MRYPSVKLRRVARIINGGTPPTAEPTMWDGDLPFVTPPDLNGLDGAQVDGTQRSITSEGIAHSGLAPEGSVILSTRAPIGHIGRAAEPVAFNQGCRALVPGLGYDSRFLAYALLASRDELMARGLGTTFIELSGSSLAEVEVPAVELVQQRAIADYLDRETAQIDAFIAKNEELMTLLTERRAASIDRAVNAAAGDRIPLKFRLSENRGGIWGDDPSGDGDTIVLRSTDQTVDGYWRMDEPAVRSLTAGEARRFRLHTGDLLVTKSSGSESHIGKVTLVDPEVAALRPAYSNFMQRLTPDRRMAPKYLWYALRTRAIRDQLKLMATSTTGLGNLTGSMIGELLVPSIPIEAQHEVVSALDRATGVLNAAIATARRGIDLARERRAALISAAVTGKVDVGVAG